MSNARDGGPIQALELTPGSISHTAADRLAAVTARAAGAPTGMIHLARGSLLHLAGGSGLPAGWERLRIVPVAATIAHQVVAEGFPVVVSDTLLDRRVPAGAPVRSVGARAYAGFPIRDPDGTVVGVCCVLDYQPREWEAHELAAVDEGAQACTSFVAEQTARALADRQRRFLDALLDSLRVAVAACDIDGKLVFANAAMRAVGDGLADDDNFLGWARRQSVDGLDGQAMAPETLPIIRALRGEQSRAIEIVVTAPDGQQSVLSTDAQPIRGAEGQTVGAIVAATDVTEQRRARRYRATELAVIQQLAHATSVEDTAPALLEAIAATLGWPHAEFWLVDQDADTLRPSAIYNAPGCTAPITVPPELRCGSGVAGTACDSGDVVWIRDIRADGSPVSATSAAACDLHTAVAVPVRSGDRTLAVLSFFADAVEDPQEALVTLLKRLAANIGQFLERRRAEDLRLALARSKDEYLALVGHEMRTPLTSIAAYTDLLRELDPEEFAATGKRLVDAVQRNSDQLRHIVDELLDLAALDTGHAELTIRRCDLVRVAQDALAGHPELNQGGFTVALDAPRECAVQGDPARLRQVIDALVGNAVAYSPDGGSITITVAPAGERMVELTVTDSGIGIPETENDQLFGRFFRGSRARDRRIPGAGLALAICRAIIERHNGSIALVPTDGQGTAVRIRVPRLGPARP